MQHGGGGGFAAPWGGYFFTKWGLFWIYPLGAACSIQTQFPLNAFLVDLDLGGPKGVSHYVSWFQHPCLSPDTFHVTFAAKYLQVDGHCLKVGVEKSNTCFCDATVGRQCRGYLFKVCWITLHHARSQPKIWHKANHNDGVLNLFSFHCSLLLCHLLLPFAIIGVIGLGG